MGVLLSKRTHMKVPARTFGDGAAALDLPDTVLLQAPKWTLRIKAFTRGSETFQKLLERLLDIPIGSQTILTPKTPSNGPQRKQGFMRRAPTFTLPYLETGKLIAQLAQIHDGKAVTVDRGISTIWVKEATG